MLTSNAHLRSFVLLVLFWGSFSTLFGQHIHSCTIIPTDEPASVAAAPLNLPPGVRYAVSYKPNRTYDQKWAAGSTVTIRFLGGTQRLQNRVMRYAREWTQYANVNFQVVSFGQADIRVGFEQNGASWSMVGNSSARANQNSPSMNFGWLTDQTPDYEVKRTVLHEFGHALGLLHEHQNPAGGIPWNEPAVYDHYWRTHGWDQRTTYHNVMAKVDHNTTQFSAYDQASIMHYPIDSRLTSGQYSVGMNNELSAMDRAYIAGMYPGRQSPVPSTAPANPPRPTTTSQPPTSIPSRPTTSTTTTPNRKTYRVGITNVLGNNQKEETVELYISNRSYVIKLDRNGQSSQRLDLDLPLGNYNYRVTTSSTYFGYRNVRTRSGDVRRQYVEQEVAGSGKGILTISGNADLSLYGSYDKESGRMKVFLAEEGASR